MRELAAVRAAAARSALLRGPLQVAETAFSWLVIRASGCFDAGWYRAQYPGSALPARLPGHSLPLAHYVARGRRAGFSPHPLMEPSFYAPTSWRSDPADPFARLLLRGRVRRAAPHPLFDPAGWVATRPQAARHRWGPFGDFCAVAVDRTRLPVVSPPGVEPPAAVLTWGQARQALLAAMRSRVADELRRRAVRPRTDLDADLARRTASRFADSAVSVGSAGSGAGLGAGEPLVSVVMPVRNRATTVGAAIASVRAQRLTSWELLVVDDGSTDGSASVAEQAAAGDPRVRVLRGPAAGVSAARNTGAAAARGEYLAWLDSDNTWTPEHLAAVVGTLRETGAAAGFSIVRRRHGTPPYRWVDPAGSRERLRELLEVSNVIDLNVLVVRRALVEQVGGFEESLRRTVDYDLVLRLLPHAVPVLVPVVGVDYADDADDAGRITVAQSPAWREVVKNRHLVDWSPTPRTPGRLSVLVAATTGFAGAWRSVPMVCAAAAEEGLDVEVVLVEDAQPRATTAVLACLPLLDARVRLVRLARAAGRAVATNRAFAASTGELVLPLVEGTALWPGSLTPLQQALGEGAAAAQPLLVDADGTVAAAGVQGPWPGTGVLAGLPVADPQRAGAVLDVPAAAEGAVLVRAPDYRAARGLDPLLVRGHQLTDLSLRVRSPERRVVLATAALAGAPGDLAGPSDPAGAAEVAARWPDLPAADDVLTAAGLARSGPSGYRRLPDGSGQPAGDVPALRWAIKIAAPVGPASRRWGDLHFAQAVAGALHRLGQQVVIDHRPAAQRADHGLDDVVLVIRGLQEVTPAPRAASLLWVISHPDLVTEAEARRFDRVLAAGSTWAGEFTDRTGVPVDVLLQATDPSLFHPGVPASPEREDVLMVANSRSVFRPIVRDLVQAGIDVALYGNGWEAFVDPRLVRARLLPNAELARHYRSAGVVLNDHWEQMRLGGFVSNRLFDAVACGARVVSDRVAGAQELFGGSVQTFETAEQLVDLVRRGPDAFPDAATRDATAARVAAEHSFDARAATLLAAALEIRGRS